MKKVKKMSALFCISVLFFSALQIGCTHDEGSQIKASGGTSSEKHNAGNETGQRSGSFDEKYLGSYRIRMTGFTGVLKIFIDSGILKGSIQFSAWGRGKRQPLKTVSIKGSKIYFIRSVSTRKELEEFGGSRYFKQQFYGKFSNDGSSIKGYFKDSGAQNSWDGRK